MRFIPDTNILIAAMARGNRQVMARMIESRAELAMSSIVLHELYFGAFNSIALHQNLERISALGLPILAFDDADARVAGELRAALKRVGKPIGAYDLLIAGQALARNLTLVTANTREFARVEGLSLEDWTAARG